MKQGIHPEYGPVVFRDRSADFAFLTRSTLGATGADPSGRELETIEWEDGQTYPVVDVEISSASHPFYTGTARVVDTAGRVEKFRRRYGVTAPGAMPSGTNATTPSGSTAAPTDQTAEGAQP